MHKDRLDFKSTMNFNKYLDWCYKEERNCMVITDDRLLFSKDRIFIKIFGI